AQTGGDILVNGIRFGNYVENPDGTIVKKQAKTDDQGNVLFDDQGNVQYDDVMVTSMTSQGDIVLKSKGSIKELSPDDTADIIADSLTLQAETGITGIELTANELTDIKTTTGNIELYELDRSIDNVKGISVKSVQTAQNADTNVSIKSNGDLIVESDATITGDKIKLQSETGNVVVIKPDQDDSLHYTTAISFDAAGILSLYRFFEAPELIEY
ncbi:MAG: hypothetical protein OMM_15126, partial [Candidatus Magnetoglobus multicellularis str. Araruama]